MKAFYTLLILLIPFVGFGQNDFSDDLEHSAYPVIFIHGLKGDKQTWDEFKTFLQNHNWSFGGYLESCLNFDSNESVTGLSDVAYFTNQSLITADFYIVDFNCDREADCTVQDLGGAWINPPSFQELYSNQSSITKQGAALGLMINEVLEITGKDKVILMGHSMGGLCSREYIQNDSHWQGNSNHRVAKLITTGTPHGGSNVGLYLDGLDLNVSDYPNPNSEAVRDLRRNDDFTLGVYLFGGNENDVQSFVNADINADGDDEDHITGLNEKDLKTNLEFTCIISEYEQMTEQSNDEGLITSIVSSLFEFVSDLASTISDTFSFSKNTLGDGVVFLNSANLENYYASIKNRIEVFQVNNHHLNSPSLTDNNYVNFKALDESDYLVLEEEYTGAYIDLAYKIECNTKYKGYFTEQSPDQIFDTPNQDVDSYKFIMDTPGFVHIRLKADHGSNALIELSDANTNTYYTSYQIEYSNFCDCYDTSIPANGDGFDGGDFGIYLNAPGTWYLRVVGDANYVNSIEFPYELEVIPLFLDQDGVLQISDDCGSQDVFGCTNYSACNYNFYATSDDGSCSYPPFYYDCYGNCLNDNDNDGICDENEILTYNCINLECIDPMNGDGFYTSIFACEDACVQNTSDSWNCVNNSCVDPMDGSGVYGSLDDCEANCSLIEPTWDCNDNFACVELSDGSGNYQSLEECEANCSVVIEDSWNCLNDACIDPQDGTGIYSSFNVCEQECQSVSSIYENDFNLNIYPNPSSKIFNLEFYSETESEILVTNILGEQVYIESTKSIGEFNTQIDLSNYSKGIYNLTIKTLDGISNHKLILQ
tara:strand:- start:116 stop:2581 length:2466 start_codon:yes stop_codon:yes gene_type:complete